MRLNRFNAVQLPSRIPILRLMIHLMDHLKVKLLYFLLSRKFEGGENLYTKYI